MIPRKKSLGQNFLTDKNILQLEARLLDPKHKTVLEIGAGDGRLTEALLAQNPKRIYAVEKDGVYVDLLHDKFCCSGENVIVLEGDFLKLDLPEFDVAIGNIPYYISSAIIFRLATLPVEKIVLVVQKEFAQKMVANPGEKNYGRLSVTSQIAFDVRLERIIPKHLFTPRPKVDSALILLKPTGKILTQHEADILRYLFSHKNQTVRNALLHSGVNKEKIAKLGDIVNERARNLTKEQCLEIANGLL